LDDSRIDGALTATARSGDISQGSGALTIGSHSVLTAAKDIALGNSSNQFGGDVYAQGDNIGLSASSALEIAQLQAAGNTRLAGHGVNLNNTSVGNDLQVDSSASITQGSALKVGGNSRFSAAGDITLDHAGNQFAGSLALIGGDVAISLADGRLLDAIQTSGNLSVTAGSTGIRQNAALQVAGRSDFNTSGDIVLTDAGNRFGGDVYAQGNNIRLGAGSALEIAQLQAAGNAQITGHGVRLRNTSVGNDLQVDSSAALTQGSALNVGGSSRFSAAGDIALSHAGNQLGGHVTLNGANVAIASANGLLLDTVQASGDLSVAAGSAGIRQNAAMQVAGRSDFNTSGDMVLADAGNR
ncbi:hypothetical protein, partial [Comamonas composti]|uniref:hypothetical protein n=1 Tax=Comamonas composti TaxID=408558 RepID=UPI001B7F88AE